ncbi:Hypothetical protein NCS54_01373900 [Fusarium falciforme]|uniref:Hypothetical protein n=1 Tax=Fusarium falciforme TaxID=195108 RepID=UPI002300EAAB|nr:Hypothetical protein NCS54_01373900 [Fusarium falciforme]WAO96078.1 Hypothetical protein NCS54_01373900 [Fusarium falciforme]
MEPNRPVAGFRNYIPPKDAPRSKELAASDTYQWAKLRCSEPFMVGWMKAWEELYHQPYKGITVDGHVIPNIYRLADSEEDLGAPVVQMTAAAQHAIEVASAEERKALLEPVDAPEWRSWINPEIYAFRHGVRLEEASKDLVAALHALMRATLSPAGYEKAHGCMKVNQFLGEVVDGTKVLNENSYNFVIFGTPLANEPWGWQLFGHHLCMNCFVVGKQMVISPVFMGAEPNVIDAGPNKGVELFIDQEQTALHLMQSLDPAIQKAAQIYTKLNGSEFPTWRHHRADQRHLGGAFQDNRVVPYEGVKVTTLSEAQQSVIGKIVAMSLNYLPEKALAARMQDISVHWDETWFCWIGGFEDGDAFYCKVHSPVVMVEFDHHSGVFLNNKEPLPFHIHTLVRTPNGNDYGKKLLEQYRQRKGNIPS